MKHVRPLEIDRGRAVAVVSLLVALTAPGLADGRKENNTRPWAYPENLVRPDRTRIHSGCLPGVLEQAKKLAKVAVATSSSTAKIVGWVAQFAVDLHVLDRPLYKFGVARGETETYQFDFSKSCNLHDVGYEIRYLANVGGRWVDLPLVFDQVLNEYVDFSLMSRDEIDLRFLKDMQTQCVQQLDDQIRQGKDPRGKKKALENCLGYGDQYSFPTWGAASLYEMAKKYGNAFYRQ